MTDTDPAAMPVHVAIVEAMKRIGHIGKNGQVDIKGGARYQYRGIDDVQNALSTVQRELGIVIIPRALTQDSKIVEAEKRSRDGGRVRSTTHHVIVHVEYTVIGPAGDTLTGSAFGEGMDNGDKATAKAMSVAFRTFLLQLFQIPTREPDPDSEVYERVTPDDPTYRRDQILERLDTMIRRRDEGSVRGLLRAHWDDIQTMPPVIRDDGKQVPFAEYVKGLVAEIGIMPR